MGLYKCIEGTFCGNPYDHGLDKDFDNIIDETFLNYGVLTFDNIGNALLSVFQILTNDNWALTMYNLMNVDNPVIAPIFFCLIVILGSFFLINIILAVILDSFIQVQQDDMKERFVEENLENKEKAKNVDMKITMKMDHIEDEVAELEDRIDTLQKDDDEEEGETQIMKP